MHSGLSPKDILYMISNDGVLSTRYKNKKMLVGLVFADIKKDRTKSLLKQFSEQLHYTSGEKTDFFMIGYRSISEVSSEDIERLFEVEEYIVDSDTYPRFFDSKVFHEENNRYQCRNQYSRVLNNSSFYCLFFEVVDTTPNLDTAYLVNFIKDTEKEDIDFMNQFIVKLIETTDLETVSLNMIESVLDKEIIKKFSNRLFKIINQGSTILPL